VRVTGLLKVLIVLFAVLAGAGVELRAIDVVEGVEVEERGIPAAACETSVGPGFGTAVMLVRGRGKGH